MKKITISILIIIAVASVVAAETLDTAPVPVLINEPNKTEGNKVTMPIIIKDHVIALSPQPYAGICEQLSNGKENVLNNLTAAVMEKIDESPLNILENLGAAADRLYAGNPLEGMAKFCNSLDWYETLDEQVKAAASFARGYTSCGVAVIPIGCIEGEPQTKLAMQKSKFAWFIPFRIGTNFTVKLLGKENVRAKVWKLVGYNPICKEWEGGFWEREIQVLGK